MAIRRIKARNFKSFKELDIELGDLKEQFDELIPEKFDFKRDFMQEILKSASVETAKRKNKSLRYFVEKYRL